MVCSLCKCAGHNKRCCPSLALATISPSEMRVAAELVAILPPVADKKVKKVKKPLEGLTGSKNLWKEPASFYIAKKVSKPLDGLAGSKNIWKEPASFYIAKKVRKPNRGEIRVAKSLITMVRKEKHLNGVGILSL